MQVSKLYVGNLRYAVTNDQLQALFSPYGELKSVNVIEGKGFGFVEFTTAEDASRAREELNGREYEGRALRIDEARPPQPRQNRDFQGRDGGRGPRGPRREGGYGHRDDQRDNRGGGHGGNGRDRGRRSYHDEY